MTTTEQSPSPAFTDAGHYQPDLIASIVTDNTWTKYFAVDAIADGYYKGLDSEGETIIVQTRDARDAQQGKPQNSSAKRQPDLFIYREDVQADGAVWTELFVAWKGKKDGYFTANGPDDSDIVLQTRAAREASFSQRSVKQVAAIDFETLNSSPNT